MNAKRTVTKPTPKPPAKPPQAVAPRGAAGALAEFVDQIERRRDELEAILPTNVTYDRFIKTALIAVKNDPTLLQADRRSLHSAVTQAAEDGIFPDGREGAILAYQTSVKDRASGNYVKVKLAQWMPMIKGIRRRARELAGLIIDTQVVHKADHFLWVQGDDPRIEHSPAGLEVDDPGPIVGAFAIIRHPKEGVLHREVMRMKDIQAVRSVSRAADGPMWTKHFAEACRKSVARRAMKSVPTVMELDRIVRRDDAHSDYAPAPAAPALPAGGDIPSPDGPNDRSRDAEDLQPIEGPDAGEEAAAPEAPEDQSLPDEDGAAPSGLLHEFVTALTMCKTAPAANKIWAAFEARIQEAGLMDQATGAFEEHALNLARGK